MDLPYVDEHSQRVDAAPAVVWQSLPGVSGRMYRAAVIGSGAHKLATRRMLRQVARAT